MYTFLSVRSIDFPRSYPPRLRVTRAGAWRAAESGSTDLLYVRVRTRGSLEETHKRQERERKRGRQEGMHTTRKQRGALSHDECVLCPTRTRARASFPVFGSHVAAALSTVTRCDTCRTNSEIFATTCTRRYPRGPAFPRAQVTHRTHNKRMRITNATVRYRVFGDNYIGRKNDTELTCKPMAAGDYAGDAFFFLFYEGEIIVRNCLHGEELLERSTKRHGTTCLSGFSCFSCVLFPYFRLQLIISILKHIRHFVLISCILLFSSSGLEFKQFYFYFPSFLFKSFIFFVRIKQYISSFK